MKEPMKVHMITLQSFKARFIQARQCLGTVGICILPLLLFAACSTTTAMQPSSVPGSYYYQVTPSQYASADDAYCHSDLHAVNRSTDFITFIVYQADQDVGTFTLGQAIAPGTLYTLAPVAPGQDDYITMICHPNFYVYTVSGRQQVQNGVLVPMP
jgi:hypothetical protein